MKGIMKWLSGNQRGAVVARVAIAVLSALGLLDTAEGMAASDLVACVGEALPGLN